MFNPDKHLTSILKIPIFGLEIRRHVNLFGDLSKSQKSFLCSVIAAVGSVTLYYLQIQKGQVTELSQLAVTLFAAAAVIFFFFGLIFLAYEGAGRPRSSGSGEGGSGFLGIIAGIANIITIITFLKSCSSN